MTVTTVKVTDDGPRRKVRRQARELLSQWDPDPRWAHPVELCCWLLAFGVFLDGAGAPDWARPAVALAGGGWLFWRSGHRWAEWEYGEGHHIAMRALTVFTTVTAGLWLYRAHPWPWPDWRTLTTALGWLVLGGVVLGCAYAVLRTQAPARARAVDARNERERERARRADWQQILDAEKLPLRVERIEDTRAGYAIALVPAEDASVTFATLQSKVDDLASRASKVRARAGETIRKGDIRAEETEAAHVHLLQVCTLRVERETVPYTPLGHATRGDNPVDVGLYLTGEPAELNLGRPDGALSGKIVGATGSGKSVLANVLTGRAGEACDRLVGVIASDKLVPYVWPWLEPWLRGQTARPAIDFVAGQDPQRALAGLAMVYRYARTVNAQLSTTSKHRATPQRPGWVLFIEEAGHLTRQRATVLVDGRQVGFSELLAMTLAACRSAQVSLVVLNQTALFDALGTHGPEVERNLRWRWVQRTMVASDGYNTLQGLPKTVDTTQLRHYSGYVQTGSDEDAGRIIQAKPYYLEEDGVHPVAVANAGYRPVPDADLVAALGEPWARRWDADRLPELVAAARANGLDWPGTTPARETTQEEETTVATEMSEGDVDRRFEELARQFTEPEPAPTGGVPDVSDTVNRIAELGEQIRRGESPVPEPLRSVLVELSVRPDVPEFVTTRDLAILLGRTTADADEDVQREAARRLGRELNAVDKALRSDQHPKLRKQGYYVADLKASAARFAGGAR